MDTFAHLASMGIPSLVVGVMPTRSLIVARPLQGTSRCSSRLEAPLASKSCALIRLDRSQLVGRDTLDRGCPAGPRMADGAAPPVSLAASVDVRSALGEELTQDAAMAAGLIRAIAAYRELRGVRQGGQQIERSRRIRSLHLGPELAGEALPASLVVRPQRLLEQRF